MPTNPKSKMSFYDIYIFLKTPKGYISLSDFALGNITYTDRDYYSIDDDSRYMLGLWGGKGFLVSPTNLDEIITLSRLKTSSPFIKTLTSLINDGSESAASQAEDILAYILAKNINTYQFGEVVLKGGSCTNPIYQFKKRISVNSKRTHPVILEKVFRSINDV